MQRKPLIIFTVVNDLTYDQRMHRICNSLSHKGYDVLLVGRKLRSGIALQQKSFRQLRLSLLFKKGKAFYIEYNLRLFFFLLFKRFDIVCGIDADTILPCFFISKIKNRKCVFDAHELFSEVPEVVRRPIIQKLWRQVEKFTVTRIPNCYTVSESIAAFFLKTYGRKFEVIRNMPLKQDAVISEDVDFTAPVILYQGALNEGRGLVQMIEAMQHLDARLILAGDGNLAQQLRSLTLGYRLNEKIFFAGLKTGEALQALTRTSHVGINLLENSGLSYYYSLANKFFDYVQAGVPQITMNFPEYQKMNEQYEVALLIDDLKTETIVSAIQRLLHEKDFYFRLRGNCLRAREEWNWQQEEIRLLSFYRRLQ